MTASKLLIKLLILWHCNINAPAHLTNVSYLTFLYLQRADSFPTDKEPPAEVSKGVSLVTYSGVAAGNQVSFFIALTNLSSLYPSLLLFSPFFGVRPLWSHAYCFKKFFFLSLNTIFLLWNGESSAYITLKKFSMLSGSKMQNFLSWRTVTLLAHLHSEEEITLHTWNF